MPGKHLVPTLRVGTPIPTLCVKLRYATPLLHCRPPSSFARRAKISFVAETYFHDHLTFADESIDWPVFVSFASFVVRSRA